MMNELSFTVRATDLENTASSEEISEEIGNEEVTTEVVTTEIATTEITTTETITEDNEKDAAQELEPDVQEKGYNVEYKLVSVWDKGYQAEVTITNCGEKTIHNWMIEYDLPDEITNIWNAEIYSHETETYRVKNAGWNRDI